MQQKHMKDKKDYKSLKAILNTSGVNLAEIDEIKE